MSYFCPAGDLTAWMQDVYGRHLRYTSLFKAVSLFFVTVKEYWWKNIDLYSTFHVYFYSAYMKTKKK